MAEVGQLNHQDGSSDLAIADEEKEGGNGLLRVVSFPEPGGTYQINHNVPRGTGGGEFSSD